MYLGCQESLITPLLHVYHSFYISDSSVCPSIHPSLLNSYYMNGKTLFVKEMNETAFFSEEVPSLIEWAFKAGHVGNITYEVS